MSRVIIFILLLYSASASARDFVSDTCDYRRGYFQCGDVCVRAYRGKLFGSQYRGKLCICGEGEDKLNIWSGDQYCCVDPSDNNKTQCTIESNGWGHCPQGRVLNKTETCNGVCYNDYLHSEVLGRPSRYRCGHKCQETSKLCRGYSSCDNLTDVSVCDKDIECVRNRDLINKTSLKTSLSESHTFCYYGDDNNDG